MISTTLPGAWRFPLTPHPGYPTYSAETHLDRGQRSIALYGAPLGTMTTRSTPGAGSSRTATSPTASTISPSGLPPIGYGHPRKSRQASSSSSYFPSVDHSRRPSSISHRQSSQTSLSGTSTPLASYPRRKRKEGALHNVPEGETDWSGLEPDEIFKRLPVGEVKRVEAKMRGEALNKQSELRSMVGWVYSQGHSSR